MKTVTTNCQIDGEDFVHFCGLLRKRELYLTARNLVLYIEKLAIRDEPHKSFDDSLVYFQNLRVFCNIILVSHF